MSIRLGGPETSFEQGSAAILEHLADDERYPLRVASAADFEGVWHLYELCAADIARKGGSNGMWARPYPTLEEKRLAMYSDIVNGKTAVAEDDDGELAGSITISSELNPMLWSERELSEPSLDVSRLMKRPGIRDVKLGQMMLYWAEHQAQKQNKLWVRLEAWDTDPRLMAYYRDDCEYQEMPSKIWANYPASARFQTPINQPLRADVNLNGLPAYSSSEDIVTAEDPFGRLADLDPTSLAMWRNHYELDEYGADSEGWLLGSMQDGRLKSRNADDLHYDSTEAKKLLNLPPKNPVEALQMGRINMPLLSVLINNDIEIGGDGTRLIFSSYFRNAPTGPINIYDMLSPEVSANLISKLGLSRFLVELKLHETGAVDGQQERGKKYLVDQRDHLHEWECRFRMIETPITTQQYSDRAWAVYEGSGYSGPGTLVEGTIQDDSLVLDDMHFRLSGTAPARPSSKLEDGAVLVVDHSYRPFTTSEFGLQPHAPATGERFMARLAMLQGDPHVHATLLEVVR